MRISFPERVPIGKVSLLASVMFCVQMIEGTDIRFSGMFMAFVMLAAIAFNIAGGFSRLVGAYIFWFSMLTCIFGVFWKALVAEPAQSNLEVPYLTMGIYATGMAMLLLVTILNRQLDLRAYSAAALLKSDSINYTTAGLGCIIFAVLENVAGGIFGITPGGVLSALRQLDIFTPLGIILATVGAVKDSDGRRSISFVNAFGMGLMFFFGLLSLSKQAMMAAPVCWFVGAAFMKLRLRKIHILALLVVVYLNFQVISPLSASRDELPEDQTIGDRISAIGDMVARLPELRANLAAIAIQNAEARGHEYYDNIQNGLVERLCMLAPDDSFFSYASRAQPGGPLPLIHDFQNWLPHSLAPDKVNDGGGNHYAHLIGGYLSADDFTTGISFSPLSEMFYLLGWWGIIAVMPFIWLLLFTSNDVICGDLKKTPWGLLVVVYFAHAAPESMVAGLIYYTWYGNVGLLFGILFCTRFAPVLGALFYGKKAKRVPTVRRRLAASAS